MDFMMCVLSSVREKILIATALGVFWTRASYIPPHKYSHGMERYMLVGVSFWLGSFFLEELMCILLGNSCVALLHLNFT